MFTAKTDALNQYGCLEELLPGLANQPFPFDITLEADSVRELDVCGLPDNLIQTLTETTLTVVRTIHKSYTKGHRIVNGRVRHCLYKYS